MTAPLHADAQEHLTPAQSARRDQNIAETSARLNRLVPDARERLSHDRAQLVQHVASALIDDISACCRHHLALQVVAVAAQAIVRLAETQTRSTRDGVS
jgi:hypothetical protein